MKMKLRHILLSIFTGVTCAFSYAMTLDEAKKAFENGDYAEALPTLQAIADKEPKNQSVNLMTGVALMRTGDSDAAIKYLNRGSNEAKIHLAEIAFYDYRFDDGIELLDKYAELQKKARKPESPDAEAVRQRIEMGQSMLDRVEKITIIDSINVDRDDFFNFYKLSAPTGKIVSANELPNDFEAADPTTVYVTESGSRMVWAKPDSLENYVLVETNRLADGSWETPSDLGTVLNEGGDTNYPFLMSDGVTLYYANDGENSLGGYDIFISRNDGTSFLAPQNIGMPYNSPYNDYLLAIDEVSGIGWWATDRNNIDDKVTIYIFLPQELRINYPVDQEGLKDLAIVKSIRNTWQPGADYGAELQKIANLDNEKSKKKAEFHFALPGRRVYTSLSDFKSETARNLMTDYLHEQAELQKTKQKLASLRAAYAKGDKNTEAEIKQLEREVETTASDLKRRVNDIVKAEK